MKKMLLTLTSFAAMISSFAQDCSQLFISEYVEGFGNNKAIEIYNPTASAINLSEYFLIRFNNGTATMKPYGQYQSNVIQLPNTMLQPYTTYVVVLNRTEANETSSDPAVWQELRALADVLLCESYDESNAMNFNGNDAVCLAKGSAANANSPSTVLIDLIGKLGEDPGGNGTGGWSTVYPYNFSSGDPNDVPVTLNHSLIRKSSIKKPYADLDAEVFNPLLEWDSIPASLPKRDENGDIIYKPDGVTPQWVGNWSSLRWHACECDPNAHVNGMNLDNVKLFPNPTTGVFSLTGLENVETIEIFNTVGQLIDSISNNTKSTVSFDLSGHSGAVMIKITDLAGRSATQKLIIK